jgi:hypothetical protein
MIFFLVFETRTPKMHILFFWVKEWIFSSLGQDCMVWLWSIHNYKKTLASGPSKHNQQTLNS